METAAYMKSRKESLIRGSPEPISAPYTRHRRALRSCGGYVSVWAALGNNPPGAVSVGGDMVTAHQQVGEFLVVQGGRDLVAPAGWQSLDRGGEVGRLKFAQVGQLLATLPPARRGVVAEAVRSGFAAGLNDLLIVTAVLAFVGAASALLLIRSQDFVRTGGGQPQAAPAVPGGAAEAGGVSQARSA